MGQITVERNAGGLEGLCVITPTVHADSRGSFTETYNRRDMEREGLVYDFVQDNQSSSARGVLRGLHFQRRHPQAKLVRCTRGENYDVAVDLRAASSTCGQHFGLLLSAENHRQLLVPSGFAHGFLVLSEEAEFCYKCDDYYDPADEDGLAWNDPVLGIAWPGLSGTWNGSSSADGYTVCGAPLILSGRDTAWPGFRDAFRF